MSHPNEISFSDGHHLSLTEDVPADWNLASLYVHPDDSKPASSSEKSDLVEQTLKLYDIAHKEYIKQELSGYEGAYWDSVKLKIINDYTTYRDSMKQELLKLYADYSLEASPEEYKKHIEQYIAPYYDKHMKDIEEFLVTYKARYGEHVNQSRQAYYSDYRIGVSPGGKIADQVEKCSLEEYRDKLFDGGTDLLSTRINAGHRMITISEELRAKNSPIDKIKENIDALKQITKNLATIEQRLTRRDAWRNVYNADTLIRGLTNNFSGKHNPIVGGVLREKLLRKLETTLQEKASQLKFIMPDDSQETFDHLRTQAVNLQKDAYKILAQKEEELTQRQIQFTETQVRLTKLGSMQPEEKGNGTQQNQAFDAERQIAHNNLERTRKEFEKAKTTWQAAALKVQNLEKQLEATIKRSRLVVSDEQTRLKNLYQKEIAIKEQIARDYRPFLSQLQEKMVEAMNLHNKAIAYPAEMLETMRAYFTLKNRPDLIFRIPEYPLSASPEEMQIVSFPAQSDIRRAGEDSAWGHLINTLEATRALHNENLSNLQLLSDEYWKIDEQVNRCLKDQDLNETYQQKLSDLIYEAQSA